MKASKYYIYRNLHVPGHFSIKYGGKVIAHESCMTAFGANFKVNAKGRERAINQQQRNVHAFVVTDTMPIVEPHINVESKINNDGWHEITYTPFNSIPSFYCKKNHEPIVNFNDELIFHNGKVYGRFI